MTQACRLHWAVATKVHSGIVRCCMATLHKLHDRAAALGQQAGQHTGEVAGPCAVQRSGLLQNGEEVSQ